MSEFTLHDLERRVRERTHASGETSYTRSLLDKGIAHCAKKMNEEAFETAMAAINEDRDRVTAEAADLLYHLLVVLEARGVTLAEVEALLCEAYGAIGSAGKGVTRVVTAEFAWNSGPKKSSPPIVPFRAPNGRIARRYADDSDRGGSDAPAFAP